MHFCKRCGAGIVQQCRVMRYAFIALFFAGCASMHPFVCDTAAPHPPRNFGVVAPGIYRGGQPTTCSELSFLKAQGVTSILKLNRDVDETPFAEKMGLHVESIPFNAHTIGSASTCADVQRALSFLATNGPVFVHCTAGKDRTGYIVGLYERTFLGRSIADVMAELHRYGHRGSRSLAFPQIDHELEKERPACAGASHLTQCSPGRARSGALVSQ